MRYLRCRRATVIPRNRSVTGRSIALIATSIVSDRASVVSDQFYAQRRSAARGDRYGPLTGRRLLPTCQLSHRSAEEPHQPTHHDEIGARSSGLRERRWALHSLLQFESQSGTSFMLSTPIFCFGLFIISFLLYFLLFFFFSPKAPGLTRE